MLILRLKQCECALRDGRLDEAYDLARAADLRAHRRGQSLVGRVVDALVKRAEAHLAADRPAYASADCDKAAYLGGNIPSVAQLRATLTEAAATQRERERMRGQALAMARRHADAGQLTLGQQVLATVPSDEGRFDVEAEAARREIAARRGVLESAMSKATEAFNRGDWEAAIEHLARAGHGMASDPAMAELAARISKLVVQRVTDAMEAGRLDLAGSLLARLDRMGDRRVETEQVRRALQQCRQAFEFVQRSEPRQAAQALRSLLPAWPRAKWLSSAAERLERMGETLEEIRSGPLGLAALGPALGNYDTTVAAPIAPAAAPRAAAMDAGPLGSKFVLRVDGVGSFQVISKPVVTIGPVSAPAGVDLALMAEAGTPVVTISRSDEDYFMQSREPVLVNDKAVTSKLLSHGDRIAIGRRARVIFRRPSAASTTAVLDLSGTRLARADVRQVILLDREIVLGPGASAHVRADEIPAPAVLQHRDGKLLCRAGSEMTVGGSPAGRSAELPAGAHVSIGTVSFIVTKE